MADGCQHTFHLPQIGTSRLKPGEIIVDLFAGGGGASEALRQALGRDPDIAINHDPDAIGMHAVNHPYTRHHCEDVWHADPVAEVAGRRVGWLHASPDCTHFSQAKGGQPRDRATRSLSWVVLKWAGSLHRAGLAPRIISLENVRQILQWGPLVAKRDPATGRVMRRTPDGWAVAGPGERVPLRDQWLIPDKCHAGRTWRAFVAALCGMGYAVEWRRLVASDYGAGTSRERLFLVARRDGAPIAWPAPTHGRKPGLLPPVPAADCIDWSIPCPSIFTRPRPLAEKTMRRIARGVQRFVIDAAEPFIVGDAAPFLTEHANGSNQRNMDATAPLGVVCAGVKGGHIAVVAPHLVKMRGDSGGAAADGSMPTITSGAGAARPAGAAHALGVVSAFIEKANGGHESPGADLRNPQPVICAQGGLQRLVTCTLSPDAEAGALRVAAFLINYYGNGQALDVRESLDTVTTRDRLALVTVHIRGVPYVIVDIGMRMLEPRELYLAQGFPPEYIIDRTADGRRLPKHAQVRMVGNSVSPPPLRAIAAANLEPSRMAERTAA